MSEGVHGGKRRREEKKRETKEENEANRREKIKTENATHLSWQREQASYLSFVLVVVAVVVSLLVSLSPLLTPHPHQWSQLVLRPSWVARNLWESVSVREVRKKGEEREEGRGEERGNERRTIRRKKWGAHTYQTE